MKVDFSKAITDLEGKPVKEGDNAVSLKIVTINALMAAFEDEKGLSGEDKLKRYTLGQTIQKAEGPVELTVEQVSMIKNLIGKAFGTLIVGSAYQLLEN